MNTSDVSSTAAVVVPPAVPPPDTAKVKRARSAVNRRFLEEVTATRKICTAAAEPDYVPALAEVEFDPALLAQAAALAVKIEAQLGELTGGRADKKNTTANEAAARKALLGIIRPIRTAAKRALDGDKPTLRDVYGVGRTLDAAPLPTVLTMARTIHARLVPSNGDPAPQDVLPGVKPAKQIKALSDAIAKYEKADAQQGEQQTATAASLEAIVSELDELLVLRHKIQLAADQAWPAGVYGVKAIRKAFLLHPTKSLKV